MGNKYTCILAMWPGACWLVKNDGKWKAEAENGLLINVANAERIAVGAGPYMFNGQLYHVQPDECNSHGGTWSEEEAGCHVVVNEALCNAYKGHWDNEVCTVDFDQFQQGVTAASTHKLAAREVNVEHYDIANNLIICALFMAALLIFVIIGTIFFTRRILVKSLKIRDAESQPRPDSASSSKSAEGENGVSCK